MPLRRTRPACRRPRRTARPTRPSPPRASTNRAKRKASVALPMPRGPLSSSACGIRPIRTAAATSLSAASWPSRSGLARGAGARRLARRLSIAPLIEHGPRAARRTAASTARCTLCGIAGGVDHDAAAGIVRGDRQETRRAAAGETRGRAARNGRRSIERRPRGPAPLRPADRGSASDPARNRRGRAGATPSRSASGRPRP